MSRQQDQACADEAKNRNRISGGGVASDLDWSKQPNLGYWIVQNHLADRPIVDRLMQEISQRPLIILIYCKKPRIAVHVDCW